MFVSISGIDYYSFTTWGDILPSTWAYLLETTWGMVKGPNNSQVMMGSSPMVRDLVEDRSTADFSIWDANHTYRFDKGEYVEITDVNLEVIFTGFIETASENRITPEGGIEHRISCVDNHYLCDKRIVAKAFVSGTVSDAIRWIVENVLAKSGENEGVTIGNIVGDTPIVALSFDYVTVSEAFDQLAELQGCTWFIDIDKKLYFQPRTTTKSSWNIEEIGTVLPNVLDNTFSKESGNPEYRNIQYIRGGSAKTSLQTEHKKGDGTNMSWTVGYKLASEPIVSVNRNGTGYVVQTVGIKGVESGKDFYWSSNDQVILQDALGTVLSSNDLLKVEYYGLYQIVIRSKDFSAIANRKAVEFNTSGLVERVFDDPLITDVDSGIDGANAMLSHYSTVGTKIYYTTLKPGIEVGTLQHITSVIHDMDDDFLITQVEKCPAYYDDFNLIDALIHYNITGVSGPVEDYWTKVFLQLNKGTAGSSVANSTSVVAQIRSYFHVWTNPDTWPDIWAISIADGNYDLANPIVPCFESGDEVTYMALWYHAHEVFRMYRTAQSSTAKSIYSIFIIASGEANDSPWDEVRFYSGDGASAATGSGILIYKEVLAANDSKNNLESVQIEFTAVSY